MTPIQMSYRSMQFAAIISLTWLLISHTWIVLNTKSRISSYGLNAKTPSKGSGIFEYSGSQPPTELAKLFGIKVDSKSGQSKPKASGSSTSSSTNAKNNKRGDSDKKKKATQVESESIDDLEKTLISKYRSSAYKTLEDDDDDEWDEMETETRAPKKRNQKFEGFNPTSKSPASPINPEVADKTEEEFYKGLKTLKKSAASKTTETSAAPASAAASEDTGKTPRKSLLLGRLSKVKPAPVAPTAPQSADDFFDYEGSEAEDAVDDEFDTASSSATAKTDYRKQQRAAEDASRSGPLNAVEGYRMRRPPPVSPEEQAKKVAAAAAETAKAALIQEKRKAKKALDDTNFAPFEFSEDSSEVAEEDRLFTTKTFDAIGVNNQVVLRNLERMRIFNPTQIQELAIPPLMAGSNVIIQAQTGSGKTLAYLLPLLDVIDPTNRRVQAIILAPSRELVSQIAQVGESVFKDTGIGILPIIGGANVRGQVNRLREERPQVVVATPGRLAELVFGLKKLRLGMVRAFIIDEVDNLLQDPFSGELEMLWEAMPLLNKRNRRDPVDASSRTPSTKTTLQRPDEATSLLVDFDDEQDPALSGDDDEDDNDFDDDYEDDDDDDEEEEEEESAAGAEYVHQKRFLCLASATGNSPQVKSFADAKCGTDNWSLVSARSAAQLPSTISHGLISCARIKALDILRRVLFAKPEVRCALIFVNDPYRVNIICDKLGENDIIAAPLHGDTSKEDRKEILSRLRDGRLQLAVTTELAARGLDLPNLTHVINFELPTDAQHYVHRAGRCGRAGRKGLVINFAQPDTKFVIRRFGKQLGVHIRDCEIRNGQVFLKG